MVCQGFSDIIQPNFRVFSSFRGCAARSRRGGLCIATGQSRHRQPTAAYRETSSSSSMVWMYAPFRLPAGLHKPKLHVRKQLFEMQIRLAESGIRPRPVLCPQPTVGTVVQETQTQSFHISRVVKGDERAGMPARTAAPLPRLGEAIRARHLQVRVPPPRVTALSAHTLSGTGFFLARVFRC